MTQDSKVAFETLGELAGLNVIFDPDFRGTRIPIDLNRVNIFDALDVLALETRSFWKPVNRTTILVSADNQTETARLRRSHSEDDLPDRTASHRQKLPKRSPRCERC